MKSPVVSIFAVCAVLAGPLLAQDTPIPRVSDVPAVTQAQSESGMLTQHSPEVEVAFWESVQDSDNPMLFLAYLEQFPDGAFRVIAKNRLDELWDRALKAFALLEEMNVSIDTPSGAVVTPAPAPAPPPVVIPAPAPVVTQPPPVVVNPPPVVVKPASPPSTGTPTYKVIRNAQNQLRKHGCYTGAVDGVWGEGSRKAMRKYNRRAGTSFQTSKPTPRAVSDMRQRTQWGVQVCR